MNAIRIACYSRVSTREQVEGLSLDVQKDAMEKFIETQKANNWVLYKHYCDAGESGTTLDRPDFQRMLSDAKDKNFDIVLVHKLDRVSRSLFNLMDLIMQQLQPIGVGFRSVSESVIETTTPAGKLMFQQFGAFAEFEVNRTLERTRDGKHRTAELGRFNGGAVPFGYLLENGTLIPNPNLTETVCWIFEEYATGKKGMRSIANTLNAKGILTQNDKKWSSGNLGYLLRNPVYKGTLAYYKRTTWKKNRPIQENPEEKWLIIDNAYEPIVSKELWDRVQLMLKKRETNGNPNRVFNHSYLLTGILYCSQCGLPMWGRYNQSRNYKMHVYCCQNHYNGKDLCPQQTIQCSRLDKYVLGYLQTIITRPGFLEDIQKELLDISVKKNPNLELDIENLKQSAQNIEDQLSRARNLCIRGVLSDEEYAEEAHRLKEQRENILRDLEDKQRRAAATEWSFLKYQEIDQIFRNFGTTVYEMSPDKKKDFITSVIERIEVNDQEIAHIKLREPFDKWINAPNSIKSA